MTNGSRLFRSFPLLTALLAAAIPAAPALAEEVVKEGPITYAKAGGVDLQLDLARPEGEGPFPAIIFIHGGGWSGGNRAGYLPSIADAAKRGYVAMTVSYRLVVRQKEGGSTNQFPMQVHDVKAAVRWLRANAKKYHVDPDRIGVTGGSAGGHLSLMLGLTDPSAKLEGDVGNADQPSNVQAVVNVFGPTDMVELSKTSPGAAPIVAAFLGGKPEERAEAYRASSPVAYVDRNDPPVLSIHGTADKLVPPEQAELLDQAMKKAGASHTLLLLEGEGHGFRGDAAKKAVEASYEFFDKHLKNKR